MKKGLIVLMAVFLSVSMNGCSKIDELKEHFTDPSNSKKTEEETDQKNSNSKVEDNKNRIDNLECNEQAIHNSLKTYSYEENPYYLEGLQTYVNCLNEAYQAFEAEQRVEILTLKDILEAADISHSMQEKILSLEGKNILEDENFVRIDENKDHSLFFSKGNYFEISSSAKYDFVYDQEILTTLYYFGDLKDNRPDGEGVIFRITASGARILCAGKFVDGRMEGKGVIFSTESLGMSVSEIGTYKNNLKNGKVTTYNNYDILQIYQLYREKWEEYKEEFFAFYSEQEKNQVLSNLFQKDVTAELMYITECYETEYAEALFQVRINYPVILPTISYDGHYKNDEYSGEGTLYGNNGALSYQGEFKRGQYSGDGKLYYAATGIVQYDGEFRSGKMKGEGTLYNIDGTVRKKGKFKGEDIDLENELAEKTSLYDSIYKKSEEVELQTFFEKDSLILNDGDAENEDMDFDSDNDYESEE